MEYLTEPSSIGERIARKRKEKGWTQEQLAKQIPISRSAIAQWETNRSGQLNANLARLARVLGITVEYLLFAGGGSIESGLAISDREVTLLRLFRECDPNDQDFLLTAARRFAGPDAIERLEEDHPLAPVSANPSEST